LSFPAFYDAIHSAKPISPKSVVLTFDDGWESQYTLAYPLLQKYHYPATFFIATNMIGKKQFMSWEELQNLNAHGMTVGSHTKSHANLQKIRVEQTM
jgi:peptidoglycan/xylan/chitin deacetylase (PgdA/CDA1 family)